MAHALTIHIFCFTFPPTNQIRWVLPGMFFFSLFLEAAVVGVVCLVFLALFVVAGIRQIWKGDDDS